MNAIEGIKYLFNIPAVPRQLIHRNSPVLMHVSDTPNHIYNYLFHIIKLVKPECFVHTGDIVDNTKLESQRHLKEEYARILQRFIFRLEQHVSRQIILIPGNHDDPLHMNDFAHTSLIRDEGHIFNFCGYTFEAAHYGSNLSGTASYSLYGHNGISINKEGYFNGYNHIYFFMPCEIPDKRILTIRYPIGIMEMRGINHSLIRGL